MAEKDLVLARAQVFGSVFMIVQHLTRLADLQLAELGITTRQWLLLAVRCCASMPTAITWLSASLEFTYVSAFVNSAVITAFDPFNNRACTSALNRLSVTAPGAIVTVFTIPVFRLPSRS